MTCSRQTNKGIETKKYDNELIVCLIYACDQETGQCNCLPNIEGYYCSECKENNWKIASGEGCEECACDPVGSTGEKCQLYNGQCDCRLLIRKRVDSLLIFCLYLDKGLVEDDVTNVKTTSGATPSKSASLAIVVLWV